MNEQREAKWERAVSPVGVIAAGFTTLVRELPRCDAPDTRQQSASHPPGDSRRHRRGECLDVLAIPPDALAARPDGSRKCVDLPGGVRQPGPRHHARQPGGRARFGGSPARAEQRAPGARRAGPGSAGRRAALGSGPRPSATTAASDCGKRGVMSNRQPSQRDRSPGLVALGGLALVLCCAGPALIAGGVLATIGRVVSNGFVIGLGVLIIAGALVFALSRRRRPCAPDEDRLPTARAVGRRRRRG